MSKHIVINNAKGTVGYRADSTAMLKTELTGKIFDYLEIMPKAKHLHLYPDQIKWLYKRNNRFVNKEGYSTHNGYSSFSGYKQTRHDVLEILEQRNVSIISIERGY